MIKIDAKAVEIRREEHRKVSDDPKSMPGMLENGQEVHRKVSGSPKLMLKHEAKDKCTLEVLQS